MSEQSRVVLFILLAVVIFFVWTKYFAPPPQPPKKQQPQTAQTAPAPEGKASEQLKALPAKPVKIPVLEASGEKTIIVSSSDYRVELSNRGAVVKSWQLEKYLDTEKPPKPLD
jgi:YidC/Oxa1 family membrane protein insertase